MAQRNRTHEDRILQLELEISNLTAQLKKSTDNFIRLIEIVKNINEAHKVHRHSGTGRPVQPELKSEARSDTGEGGKNTVNWAEY